MSATFGYFGKCESSRLSSPELKPSDD